MPVHGKQAELQQLRQENEQLRQALEEQWEANHFEHCGRDWPHPTGRVCHWPRPEILDGYSSVT